MVELWVGCGKEVLLLESDSTSPEAETGALLAKLKEASS